MAPHQDNKAGRLIIQNIGFHELFFRRPDIRRITHNYINCRSFGHESYSNIKLIDSIFRPVFDAFPGQPIMQPLNCLLQHFHQWQIFTYCQSNTTAAGANIDNT